MWNTNPSYRYDLTGYYKGKHTTGHSWSSSLTSVRGVKKPALKKAGELLSLNRNQLRIVTGFLTGHWHSKGLLFKLGLVNSPECDRCKLATETASHLLCD
jgi:hypothetical protein